MLSARVLKLSLTLCALAGGAAVAATALWPRAAVSTEDEPLEAFRGSLRDFQTLRLFLWYGQYEADASGEMQAVHRCRGTPDSWTCSGTFVVTLAADGRVSIDRELALGVRRVLLLPSGAWTYDVGLNTPDIPSTPLVPLGELEPTVRAFVDLLRSGLGTGMATMGTAEEFGVDDRTGDEYPGHRFVWYELPIQVPGLGLRDVHLARAPFGAVQRIRVADGPTVHVISIAETRRNFEIEARWFDTDLVYLHLPSILDGDFDGYSHQIE